MRQLCHHTWQCILIAYKGKWKRVWTLFTLTFRILFELHPSRFSVDDNKGSDRKNTSREGNAAENPVKQDRMKERNFSSDDIHECIFFSSSISQTEWKNICTPVNAKVLRTQCALSLSLMFQKERLDMHMNSCSTWNVYFSFRKRQRGRVMWLKARNTSEEEIFSWKKISISFLDATLTKSITETMSWSQDQNKKFPNKRGNKLKRFWSDFDFFFPHFHLLFFPERMLEVFFSSLKLSLFLLNLHLDILFKRKRKVLSSRPALLPSGV